MSRRKAIAVVALVLVAVFVSFASLGPRVSSMFDTAGASLSGGSSTYAGSRAPGAPAAPTAPARPLGEAGRAADATAAQAVAGQAPPAQSLPGLDRLVIRNVSMTLVTPNVRDVYYLVEQ